MVAGTLGYCRLKFSEVLAVRFIGGSWRNYLNGIRSEVDNLKFPGGQFKGFVS